MADVVDRFPETAFDSDSGFAAPALPQHDVQATAQGSPMVWSFGNMFDAVALPSLPPTVQATPQSFQKRSMPGEYAGVWRPEWKNLTEWQRAHPVTTIAEQTSQVVQPDNVAPLDVSFQVDPGEPPELIFDDAPLKHGSSVDDDLPDFGNDRGFCAEGLDELLSQYYGD